MTDTLIVYFSVTNCTKLAAEMIRKLTGADILRLETVKEYPTDFHTLKFIAEQQINERVSVPLKTKIPDLRKYKRIFIGSPIWFNTIAPPIKTFLENANLSGKDVAIFATHGDDNVQTINEDVQGILTNVNLKQPILINGDFVHGDEKRVKTWLQNIKM